MWPRPRPWPWAASAATRRPRPWSNRWPSAPAAVRPAVAEGCILCAEKFLAEGKSAEAVKLYDAVRKADVPKQRVLEATRGAILARESAGVPLLVEQLRSADKGRFGIGLRTARELPGRDVTEALAAELERLSPDRQPLLLLALADRSDAAVLPAVVKAAQSGPKELRIAAVGVLTRLGNVSCVPVLLDAAAESDADVAQAAQDRRWRSCPARTWMPTFSPACRKRRARRARSSSSWRDSGRLTGLVPAIMSGIEDADAGVRSAAVQAIGALGSDKQAADLVKLLQKTQDAEDRADIEKALLAISGRAGASCVPYLLPLDAERRRRLCA